MMRILTRISEFINLGVVVVMKRISFFSLFYFISRHSVKFESGAQNNITLSIRLFNRLFNLSYDCCGTREGVQVQVC